MPLVNIRIIGQTQQKKDEISKRVTGAICDVTGLPREAVWVLFEDVGPGDWYVGATSVEELKKGKS